MEVGDRIPGSLTQIDLDVKEREILLDYMAVAFPRSYTDFIWTLLGDDKFLMFFDVLEGLDVKVPSRPVMSKIVSKVSIYSYLKERNCTEEAIHNASILFKKKETLIRKIYDEIEEAITEGVVKQEEDNEE